MLFHSFEQMFNELQLYMYYEDKVVVIDSKKSQQELELFHDGNKIFTYKYQKEDSYICALDMFVDLLHMCSMIITEDYHERIYKEDFDQKLMELIGEYVCQFYTITYAELLEWYKLTIDSIRKCFETRTLFKISNVGDLIEELTGRISDTTFHVEVYTNHIVCSFHNEIIRLHVDTLLSIFEIDESEHHLELYRESLRNIYAKTLLTVLVSYVK